VAASGHGNEKVAMNASLNHPISTPSETELVRVLAHRYGDGMVYLLKGTSRAPFVTCQRVGLISDDGYITRAGRELAARHCA
jgi:hypothetical protein